MSFIDLSKSVLKIIGKYNIVGDGINTHDVKDDIISFVYNDY